MTIKITGAPCCWGVDNPKNPYLPSWERVMDEAAQAGYKGLELGPYGYIPLDINIVGNALRERGLTIVAGTIFDDLLSENNYENIIRQVHDICSLLTKLPQFMPEAGQHFPTPYLVLIDWGHEERDYNAGHPGRAPRLQPEKWALLIRHIKALAHIAHEHYGVRAVIHPHAGGYIEFADEIQKILEDIPYELAGLCLDTGHLYYSKMEPLQWLRDHADRLDYIHFKDINDKVYRQVMNEQIKFFDACAKGVMCPIGQGVIDYPEIYKLLKAIDYQGYITIEQERDPRNSDTSLQDVSKSLQYLRSIGF